MSKNPIATIHMASGENIRIELYPEMAPNTVRSFVWLAKQGAFDNRSIKRIVPGFVIQPSYNSFDEDPLCDFKIPGEFRANGFQNELVIEKYTVAMGGDGVSLASGSCFFIAVEDCREKLDGKYAGFGKVIDGFEVIERLVSVALVPVENDLGVTVNEPASPEIMMRVEVDTFGQEYDEPERTEGVWAYEKAAIKIGGLYRHFKGNEYRVLHLAQHSETLEDLVVYQALYGEMGIWVRPLSMFVEHVVKDGKRIRRFQSIE